MNKIGKIVLSLLLVFGSFFGCGQLAQAAEPDDSTLVNITVHKRLFDRTQLGATLYENTGMLTENFGGAPQGGAEFTLFDVSAEYYANLADQQVSDATDVKLYVNTSGDGIAKITTEAVNGTGVFNNIPSRSRQDHNKYAAYLIRETGVPSSSQAVSQDILLVLPVPTYSEVAGQQEPDFETVNRDIHLYPKNTAVYDQVISKKLVDATGAEITDTNKANQYFGVGETITYQVTMGLDYLKSVNANQMKVFGFTDTPDTAIILDTVTANLTYNNGTADLDLSSYFTLPTANNGSYTITSSESGLMDSLVATGAEQVVFTLTGHLAASADLLADFRYYNTAKSFVEYNEKDSVKVEALQKPAVYTGGKVFSKADADDYEFFLGGAQFYLYRLDKDGNKEYFVTQPVNGSYWTAGTEGSAVANAWTATSSSDQSTLGEFEVIGLPISSNNYYLEEFANPTNYVKPASDFSFTVALDTYAKEYTETTDGEGQPSLTTVYADRDTVPNIKEDQGKLIGFLPSTGGTGFYLILLAGLAVLATALLALKKLRNHKQEV